MKDRNRPRRQSRRNPEAIAFARAQRKQANEFAQDVWQMLRNRRCHDQKFRREYPIPPYTADFCCVALQLIVEVDGEPHRTEEGQRRDARRDRYLATQGYQVLRIPGFQVTQDPSSVYQLIEQTVDARIIQLKGR